MYCENVESVKKKKKERAKSQEYNFAIANLTAHTISLLAYYQYTPKFPKAAIKIMKWSRSKSDIVVQHSYSDLFPGCHFFLPYTPSSLQDDLRLLTGNRVLKTSF